MTLENLRNELGGRVACPGDEHYSQATFAWNRRSDSQAAVVVDATGEACVQSAVNYANRNDLPISVIATGHGQPRCAHDAMLVRTSRMKQVQVDPIARTAKLQSGALWSDVLTAAHPHGLAALSGSSPAVGAVGYTIGGGFGLMLRKYGFSVDRVRSFRVVTMDGEAVVANANENADLFYALRGGGGTFGIVTEMEIELVPEPNVFGGSVMFPIEEADAVMEFYANWSKALPNDVTTSISLMHFPPVPFVPPPLRDACKVIVTGCACLPEAKAMDVLDPLRSLPGAEFDSFRSMPYTENACIHQDPVDPLPAGGLGMLVRDLTPDVARRILTAVGPMDRSPNIKVDLRQLGGAARDFAADSAPVSQCREASNILYLLGVPMGPVTVETMAAHAEHVISELADAAVCTGPLNWLGEVNVRPDHVRGLYTDAEYARLAETKRNRDPHNRLRFAGIGIE